MSNVEAFLPCHLSPYLYFLNTICLGKKQNRHVFIDLRPLVKSKYLL